MARRIATTPRKAPTQQRARATVDAIVEATARILVKDGYDGVSTNRVAAEAGVSIGSLYQYFPNREALVGEVVDRHSHALTDMVLDRIAALHEAAPEVVVPELVRAVHHAKRKDHRLAKVIREQIPRVGRMRRYEDQLSRITEVVAAYLEGVKERLRVSEPQLAAFLAVHLVDALTHEAATRRSELPEERVAEEITEIVLRYLLA